MTKKETAKFNKMFTNFEGVLNSIKTIVEDNPDHTFTLSELKDWDLMYTDRNFYQYLLIVFEDANLIFKSGWTESGERKYMVAV